VQSTDVSSLNRSRSCAGFNLPSSQLTLWTCSHTCPPSLCGVTSICHSVVFQTRVGGIVQSTLETCGLANSTGSMVAHLLTSGDGPSCVNTQEWRYGPWRKCVSDDDDETASLAVVVDFICLLVYKCSSSSLLHTSCQWSLGFRQSLHVATCACQIKVTWLCCRPELPALIHKAFHFLSLVHCYCGTVCHRK